MAISFLKIKFLRYTDILSAPNTTRRYPLSYVYSGYYGWWDGGGSLETQDSRGIFWSTTTNGNAQAYRLSVWTSLDTLSVSGFTAGNSLRFTLRPSVSAFVRIFRTLRLECWRHVWPGLQRVLVVYHG
ncbi:hypothetical protein IJG78_02035 [Candidatus Saccharibacteria bacterium]|nr:hypothetical protein [Candidatus Saccharibacteria bacterium]